MDKINRLFSKVFAFFYLLTKVSFKKRNKKNEKLPDIVVWIKVNPITKFFSYLKYNDLLADLSIIIALQRRRENFKIVFGSQIGEVNNKNIFYSISESCNPYMLANYSMSLYFTLKLIESQNNILFPKIENVLLWENKAYMHRKFKELDISNPETIILDRNDSIEQIKLPTFPLLVKEIHSAGSRGIHLVNDNKELVKVIDEIFSKGHKEILIQKLVNMRKDLRLVLRGDKIVSFYWRINPDNKWKPTATSFGGFTRFDDFPNIWLSLFIEYLKRLELETAAFDITWENDDISSLPLVLEVSPSYQLNPELPSNYKNIPYKTWKKKLFIKNSYYKEYVDVVLENNLSLVDLHLSLINQNKT
jgi:glutathione synthase/RimK-type ligase-like ATP-grasp enzyme